MRLRDTENWRLLLGDLGLHEADQDPPLGLNRAALLWLEGFWLDVDVAKVVGLKVETVKSLRRTNFRDATWAIKAGDRSLRLYHIIAGLS